MYTAIETYAALHTYDALWNPVSDKFICENFWIFSLEKPHFFHFFFSPTLLFIPFSSTFSLHFHLCASYLVYHWGIVQCTYYNTLSKKFRTNQNCLFAYVKTCKVHRTVRNLELLQGSRESKENRNDSIDRKNNKNHPENSFDKL